MPTPKARQGDLVFPLVVATGGIESCASVALSLDSSRLTDDQPGYIDCAGCLDAPSSLPAGSCIPFVRHLVRREGTQ